MITSFICSTVHEISWPDLVGLCEKCSFVGDKDPDSINVPVMKNNLIVNTIEYCCIIVHDDQNGASQLNHN